MIHIAKTYAFFTFNRISLSAQPAIWRGVIVWNSFPN